MMFRVRDFRLRLCLLGLSLWPLAVAGDEEIQFGRDILPILSDNCFECHGPDASAREADLRLDDPALFSQVTSSDLPVIAAGNPDGSELIYRVTTDDEDDIMPPPEFPKQLDAHETDLLRKWIKEGAKWEQHWSFLAPKDTAPEKFGESPAKDPIDLFIEEALFKKELKPQGAANDATWLRRVCLDLTGLLPDSELLAELENSGDRERVVDALLASERFGEHLAWNWLEAARYADTHGYQKDNLRSMWLWRDWVVSAFNRNQPFDQFTIEQLAGDLLPNPTREQLIATGFNRNHRSNAEAGAIPEEFLTETVIDRVDATSTVWMGMTASCARCHDHKFDPLTQREFFGLYAFFNNIDETGVGGVAMTVAPDIEVELPGYKKAREAAEARLTAAQKVLEDAALEAVAEFANWKKGQRKIAEQASLALSGAPTEAKGTADGSTFTPQKDGSVLFGGSNPLNDVHSFRFETVVSPKTALTTLDLIALPDPALTNGSLSRSFAGDFLLSEIEIHINGSPVALKAAGEFSLATDGDPLTGWSPGPGRKEAVSATFVLKQPRILPANATVEIVLRYESREEQFMIGRPRFVFGFGKKRPQVAGMDRSVFEALLTANEAALATAFRESAPAFTPLRLERDEAVAAIATVEARYQSRVMVMRERDGDPRPTHLLGRGLYDQPGEEVPPFLPAFLPSFNKSEPSRRLNRLDLARWLTDSSHPLTARVTVNRFWQSLFGTGLVKTAEDFGVQGERPSHPDLLDHLSVAFVESGWDIKGLLKRIVLTETYSRNSARTPQQLEIDPENRWLASGPRMRLSGAVLRDQALQVGGLLDEKIGGPPVRPWQPPGLWKAVAGVNSNTIRYQPGPDAERRRRSLYTLWKRGVPPPSMMLFDSASREVCSVGVQRTNTPLQALVTLNDPTFVSAAVGLASESLRASNEPKAALAAMWRRLFLSDLPVPQRQILDRTLESHLDNYLKDPAAAERRLEISNGIALKSIDDVDLVLLAALTEIAEILLNLDSTLTKY